MDKLQRMGLLEGNLDTEDVSEECIARIRESNLDGNLHLVQRIHLY